MILGSDVKYQKTYSDDNGNQLIIQAGPTGWVVIYADQSCEYEDFKSSTQQNFGMAYNKLTKKLGKLTTVENLFWNGGA